MAFSGEHSIVLSTVRIMLSTVSDSAEHRVDNAEHSADNAEHSAIMLSTIRSRCADGCWFRSVDCKCGVKALVPK